MAVYDDYDRQETAFGRQNGIRFSKVFIVLLYLLYQPICLFGLQKQADIIDKCQDYIGNDKRRRQLKNIW